MMRDSIDMIHEKLIELGSKSPLVSVLYMKSTQLILKNHDDRRYRITFMENSENYVVQVTLAGFAKVKKEAIPWVRSAIIVFNTGILGPWFYIDNDGMINSSYTIPTDIDNVVEIAVNTAFAMPRLYDDLLKRLEDSLKKHADEYPDGVIEYMEPKNAEAEPEKTEQKKTEPDSSKTGS